MRLVLHRDIPDDPQLQLEWNALVQQMEIPEVFYTHQWALAVRKAYGGSLTPMLMLAYEEKKLRGVAALATDPKNQQVTFLCGSTADYCDFVSAPDGRVEFLEAVLEELDRAGFSKISLTSIPADSATIPVLRSLGHKRSYHLFVRLTALCAQVKLGAQDERVTMKAALARKKIFRYSMNSFRKEGEVSFRHLATWAEIEPALHSFSTAHVARFLATGRISNIVSAQRRIFLNELAFSLSNSGWLALSQLLVGERTVAWNYGFRFHGSWFWYQPTFDTSYERLSPGYCLLSRIISEACEQEEVQTVDLGLGAEGYKERFGNNVRSTLHATLTKSFGQHTTEMIRYSAAHAIKSVPQVESAVRTVLQSIGRSLPEAREKLASSVAGRVSKRASHLFHRRQEIVFYQWMSDLSAHNDPSAPAESSANGLSLGPINLEMLALAAMAYENEPDTLSYLLASARRLQQKGQGFALFHREVPVSFCQVGEFEGFQMKELKTQLGAPSPNAAIIFEWWTPHSRRGRRYFTTALFLAAQQIVASGKEPWTFTACSDRSLMEEIEAAGFARRYSFFYKKTMAWQRVSKVALDGGTAEAELPAGS